MNMKYCPKCKEEKPLTTDFWYVSKSVVSWQCKECQKAARRLTRVREGNREKISPKAKYCNGCKETKLAAEFPRNKTERDGLHDRCKACCSNWFSSYYHGDNATERNILTRLSRPIRKIPEYRDGYVYLFKLGDYYKIGISVNPVKRLASLSGATPFDVELLHKISTNHMQRLEDELHQRFHDKRVKNEWFLLNAEDVRFIMRITEHAYEPS